MVSRVAGKTEAEGLAYLEGLAEAGRIADDWAAALTPVAAELAALDAARAAERAAGVEVLPPEADVYRAFERPLARVRVLVVGQDPYPTPGHAMGYAFAAARDVRPLPRSLANLYRELHDDLGIDPAPHPDISAWADQGVLLLNRVLTVRAGEAGAHRRMGWERVTDCAIDALAARGGPLVAILWGNDARALAPRLAATTVIESAHPSPLSARRGFFGSRPFSRANAALEAQGAAPIDWRVA
ncbi:uracil-DNA glycosylase [Leucobacter salsicius]|uniref:uracil-DNA glycosylase n=1 Tax=Leucobacter salsicius TaxID=664638 RepID=UPI000345CECA|nr:uracil-DNA glycosylase [Leucobacter salsicius]